MYIHASKYKNKTLMAKVNFLNQTESFNSESYVSHIMVMQIIKPENEGTLFREHWKERSRKRTEQDWTKICWNEVENEEFENKIIKR